MEDTLIVADKIFEILQKEDKLKCSFFKREKGFCYIKVENHKNNNQNCIIVENDIFFQVDDEEYFELKEYEEATKKFINKLYNMIDVLLSYTDENNELYEYGFYSSKRDNQEIIEETIDRINTHYSFMKNIKKMKVSNFLGDFSFEANWNGKTFLENTNVKR